MLSESSRLVAGSLALKRRRGLLWFLLIVLALIPLFPLTNFVGHPRWGAIRWIPFQDFSLTKNFLIDTIGNIGWFIVFGYLLHYLVAENSSSVRSIAKVVLMTAGISLSIEFFQVFCRHRTPSMTDVLCNTVGAGLGAYFSTLSYARVPSEPVHITEVKADGPKTPLSNSQS
jgi:glycopeptide antibiotics resistance protein